MKIGLVGSGGREHAVAEALMRNRMRDTLFVYGGHHNPGIERLTEKTTLGAVTQAGNIVEFFAPLDVDFVVVGPEAPLLAGVVDALREAGIPAVGPTGSQARLEGDKSFMRRLLRERVGWGSPAWQLVSDRSEAAAFIESTGEVVVKPVGLTGGKGVQVMGVHLMSVEAVLDTVDAWIEQDGHVLLEERLVGEEFSRMAFISGDVVVPMPLCQDFKYAFDGDEGGMTGGMGSYSFADGSMPFVDISDLIQADILLADTINALEKETGQQYHGFLYGQFMATGDGIRVIEYNARLGDPEAINVMALLEGDVPEIMAGIAKNKLDEDKVQFIPQASLCKYLVPSGYPGDVGEPVTFTINEDAVHSAGFSIIYASVEKSEGVYRTLGSRTLAIAGLGVSPDSISVSMESLLDEIQPAGLRHRMDVGDAAVIQEKIARMAEIRGVEG